MVASSSNRRMRYGTVLVLSLVLLVALVGPLTIPTAAAQGQNQSQRHTLVIIHVAGSPSWSIAASGSIQLDPTTTENTDSIGGMTASGSVGGLPWEDNASDPRDVIYYTGEILQFDLGGTGTARITLDGKRVTPTSLKNTPTPTPTTTTTTTTVTQSPPSTTTTVTQPPTTTTVTQPPTTTTVTQPPPSTETGSTGGGPITPTWVIVGLAIAVIFFFIYIDN